MEIVNIEKILLRKKSASQKSVSSLKEAPVSVRFFEILHKIGELCGYLQTCRMQKNERLAILSMIEQIRKSIIDLEEAIDERKERK